MQAGIHNYIQNKSSSDHPPTDPNTHKNTNDSTQDWIGNSYTTEPMFYLTILDWPVIMKQNCM